jgi:hypothetical protein
LCCESHGKANTSGEAPTPDLVRTSDSLSLSNFSYQIETAWPIHNGFALGVKSLLYRVTILIAAKSARQGFLFPKPAQFLPCRLLSRPEGRQFGAPLGHQIAKARHSPDAKNHRRLVRPGGELNKARLLSADLQQAGLQTAAGQQRIFA